MASKFPEYTLPRGSAVLRPDEKGFAALETAGRRIGPAYDQAARDYTQIGKLQDEAFRAQDWPLDFAAFGAASEARSAASGGGVNFKVSNAGSGFGGTTGGGGGGHAAASGGGVRQAPSQAGHTVASAAHLVNGWSGNTGDIAPNILRGGRSPQDAAGGPTDVGQGGLTDPFSPNYQQAGEQTAPQSNWNYTPEAFTREELPNTVYPGAPSGGGGIGQFFSDMWSGVAGAVSNASASGVDSSAPSEGSF